MEKATKGALLKTLTVMASVMLICLAQAGDSVGSRTPDADRLCLAGSQSQSEYGHFDFPFSAVSERPEASVLLLARMDPNTEVQCMSGGPGGSIWEQALENRHNLGNGNDDGNANDDNNNEGDNNGENGGRLVDPDRDVRWGDGTITPDGL